MIVGLVILSLLGVVLAVALPGWSDLLLLAGPCLLASLWLWWRARVRRRDVPLRDSGPAPRGESPFRRAKAKVEAKRPHVIIDGSNVMHWQDNIPSLEPVVQAVRLMEDRGFVVGVIFDANAGYKVFDRYQDDHHMARRLGLPEDQVLVVPKGVAADEYVLQAAQQLGARVVTNDRYRDWQARFPQVAAPGYLIRGGVRDGALWLNPRDLSAGETAAASP